MLKSTYPYLDNDVLKFIDTKIIEEPNFSEDLFKNWLTINKVNEKRNPSAYVNKVFLEQLRLGTFTKEPELVHESPVAQALTMPMFCHMREIGIKVLQESTGDIDTVMNYILRNKILTPNELAELNRSIINHLKENSVSSDGFIPLMKQSKTLQGKINWKDVDQLIEKNRKEWAEIFAELDALI